VRGTPTGGVFRESAAAVSSVAAASVLLLAQPTLAAGSVFEGQYSDPFHPGCLRKVEADGNISGTDGTPGCLNGEPQKAWELKGVIDEDGQRIFIDFQPKGGPKDLTGVWTAEGIRFPDGNLWKKISN